MFEDCAVFESFSADDIARILRKSKLSRIDKQIAVSRITWRMFYSDIAASVERDRKTVSERFKNIIVPEMLKHAEDSTGYIDKNKRNIV